MSPSRFRWTWSDTVITAFVIIFIIILVQKIQLTSALEMPEQHLTMTIVAEQQDLFFKDAIKVGDPIYQKGSAEPFGTIIDVQEKPAKHLSIDYDGGRFYYQELEKLLDVHIVIEAVGFQSLSQNPVVDQTFFHLNQYLPVMTPHAHFATRVVDIRWKGTL